MEVVRRLRVGVVGCGSIGARYVRWLGDLGRMDVAAHDLDSTALSRVACESGVQAFATLDELLHWSPDAVIVATPPSAHEAVALPVLHAGGHVLVEKPIAHTLESARSILAGAADAGRPLYVVCNMRFHPGPATIHRHLAEIGEPLFSRAYFGHALTSMRPGRDHRAVYAAAREMGGGAVLDCIHEFDYQQWLFGPIEEVGGWAGTIGLEGIDAEDYAEILLGFRNGMRSSIHLDFLQRFRRRGCEVVGTEGTLLWESEGKNPQRSRVRLLRTDQTHETLHASVVDSPAIYRRMLAEYLDTIAGGGPSTVLQTGEEAIRTLAAALLAREQAGTILLDD